MDIGTTNPGNHEQEERRLMRDILGLAAAFVNG
jgi:hypothetical protein